MAWGDGRSAADLKKEILESEEIKKLQTSIDGVSTGLDDKIKNAVTEATKGTTETLDGLKNTLASLAAKLTGPNKGGENKGGEGSNSEVTEEADWMLEPERAASKLIDGKLGGVTMAVANMRADMNYREFRSTGPRGFVQFEKEIKEMWDKESLVTKQNPKIIENIYKIVVANHIDEIAKGGESFFVEPSVSSSRADLNAPKKKPEELLSADELELAKKWGVTAEDYLKEKSGLTGVTYA